MCTKSGENKSAIISSERTKQERKQSNRKGEFVMLMREKIAENRLSAYTTGMKKEGKEKYHGTIRRNKLNGRYYAIGYENIQRIER